MTLVNTGSWYYGYDPGGRLTKLQSPSDGTTTFAYDGVGGRGSKDAAGLTQYGLLSTQTDGNGNYELYDYDKCSELISTGYWWDDGTQQNSLVYGYDPAGNVKTVNQGFYSTTYGYDGADQLTSETSTGGSAGAPPTLGYTYDMNGNRLTQTSNGSQVQSFQYDAHDKLTAGTAGSEADGYDAMGNETSNTIYGGTYHFVYDDEDRLTSLTLPSGVVDSFTYNGLGLRVGKTDSTGSYAYVCDGTSPASPVLTDGHTLYTPGLSENKGGTSRYYANDQRGNLWTLDNSSQGQSYYQDTTGFGTLLGFSGSSSVFGYGGGNGCQSDADTGLILMGHRYYDTRIGRFISQDPIGDGDNWYAYADNSPTNEIDPLGLDAVLSFPIDGPGSQPQGTDTSVAMGVANIEDYTGVSLSSLGYWTKGVPVGQLADGQWYNKWEASTNWAADTSLDGTPADLQLTKELAAADDGTAGTLSQPKGWGKGTYDSAEDCAKDHFERKGSGVNAKNYEAYLRKAEAFSQNLKRATTKTLENGATRFTKAGQYIIKDIDGLIVSYGKSR